MDGSGTRLVDRDRRRDLAGHLRLTLPRLGGQLDRRAVALPALVVVGVGEEDRVVSGDVEVVEPREHVAVGSDDEQVRSRRREVDRGEAAAVGTARLVGLVECQPRVPERQSLPAVAQPPDVGHLAVADRGAVARGVEPAAVLDLRDDGPGPGEDPSGERVPGPEPGRRAPAGGPVPQRRILQRAVHRVDALCVVQGDELVVVDRDRVDASGDARGQRQRPPGIGRPASAPVDRSGPGGELEEAVERLAAGAQQDLGREPGAAGCRGPGRREPPGSVGGELVRDADGADGQRPAALLARALGDDDVRGLGGCGPAGERQDRAEAGSRRHRRRPCPRSHGARP